MDRKSLAVIGVGNMAKAIINGIVSSEYPIDRIVLFDLFKEQMTSLLGGNITSADSASEAVGSADCVLLSVKPQNYDDVLTKIKETDGYKNKLYISIGAGISTDYVKKALGDVSVIRVLPNVPILIGKGLSVICRNNDVEESDFAFVEGIFNSAGSVIKIDENEMNRIIGVTSSSPAYVFKFIDAVCQGAKAQGLSNDNIKSAVCDMVIGAALMLKNSDKTPSELISTVASKGGTTEQALIKLDEYDFSKAIIEAMIACTNRADELGGSK